jgi:pilus assembly protein CpaB
MRVLAVAMGAMSVYLARDWLERQGQTASANQPSMELTKIVVAKLPMNFGDTVTSEYLAEVDWPAATVPPEAFTSIEELTGTDERRVVLRAIQVNEPVLASKLSGAGGKATLSTILETDMRAVTIRVNDVNGVAGFVLPGDKVDVLLTRDESGNRSTRGGNPITDILLHNVKVLGIDQKANDDEDKPKVARAVTLEVEPYDAQKLALASTVGSLSLALRNQADAEAEYTRTVRISDLKARIPVKETIEPASVEKDEAPVAVAAPKKRKTVYVAPPNPFAKVTVVRGVDSSTQSVLKDKAGNPIIPKKKAATALPPAGTQEEPAQKGPKILVPPQG